MKLSEVLAILKGEILTGEHLAQQEIDSACGSDLMSDVLAFVKHRGLLLTGLINPQVIRTAEMMDIKAIAFVRGKRPGEDAIELAKNRGIMLMTTKYPLYIACGRLYGGGLTGGDLI